MSPDGFSHLQHMSAFSCTLFDAGIPPFFMSSHENRGGESEAPTLRVITRPVLDHRAEGSPPRGGGSGLQAPDNAPQPRPVEADHHLTAYGRHGHTHLTRAAHHLLGRGTVTADVALLVGNAPGAKELRSLRDKRQYGQDGVV